MELRTLRCVNKPRKRLIQQTLHRVTGVPQEREPRFLSALVVVLILILVVILILVLILVVILFLILILVIHSLFLHLYLCGLPLL